MSRQVRTLFESLRRERDVHASSLYVRLSIIVLFAILLFYSDLFAL